MTPNQLIRVCATAAFFLASGLCYGQGNGHGHGRGHNKGRHGDDEQYQSSYSRHDKDEMRLWYREHDRDLPPGLAKRDRLPPGLERQLVVRGTLPPGLRKKIEPCPPELVRELPPPPADCEHVVIGGHLVLLNRRNFVVVDVFHFELE